MSTEQKQELDKPRNRYLGLGRAIDSLMTNSEHNPELSRANEI